MIGKILNNHFKVTAQLGTGAMGEVLRATDLQTNQEVALKIMARHLTFDPDMLERFRREGEALKQLRHPNIVSFVEMFEWEGQQVIVMEYVPGGSLYQLIRQGPLPVNSARHIALDLCDALTRAHRLNIIHRDIKPENILLAQDGTPRLTDLGVARLVGEGTRLTGTGTQVGTPYYMSPEAWQGQHLDAQTDIWSLGVVLYEMLGGQVPFGGETMVAVMNKVLTAPLPDLKALRPDVPDALVKIIRRMLARDKAKRYGSMRLVAADLEQLALPANQSTPPLARTGQKAETAAPTAKSALPLWIGLGLAVVVLGVLCTSLAVGGFGLAALNNQQSTQTVATQTAIWMNWAAAQTSQAGDNPAATETPSRPNPTQILAATELAAAPAPTEAPPSTATALPPTAGPLQTLVVCMETEPASLYLYGDESAVAATVRQGLMDGPIDLVDGQYQPVLLEQLPSLENGDLRIDSKLLKSGDPVVDFLGTVTTLAPGLRLMGPDGKLFNYTGGSATVAQLQAVFRMRRDMLWADGQPVTAADSVFSYNMAKAPDTPNDKTVTNLTAAYQAVDDYTLQWTGLPGFWSAQAALNFFAPLPEHAYGRLTPAQVAASADIGEAPLSWGPFVVDRWVKGDSLTLKPNPRYYRAAEGLPRLGAVRFRFIPDPNMALDDLESGQCQVLVNYSEYPLVQQSDRLRQLESQQNVALQTLPTMYENMYFGIESSQDYRRPAGNDLFTDVRVRQALAYCIDQQALIDQAYGGFGAPPNSYYVNTDPRHAFALATYAFDPAQGLALLKAAGWSDTNGDGVLDKGGRKFSITYHSTTSALRQTVAPLIVGMLERNCHISVQLNLLGFNDILSDTGVVPTRKFDLAEFAWVLSAGPIGSPCGVHMPAQGQAHTGYANDQFDAACERENNPLDLNPAPPDFFETQRILAQDLPALVLFHRVKFGLARPEVEGFYLAAGNVELQNLETLNVLP